MEKTVRLTSSKLIIYIFFLSLILLLTILTALSIGSVTISFVDIIKSFFGSDTESLSSDIIFKIRLPRIILALAVGGGLSVAGAVFQAILMNPLAEPYILGISSGGTFGAVLAMVLGLSFLGVQAFAFIGALIVIGIVFLIGKRFGELEPNVMLLSGVMVGAFFSAIILLMINFLNESLRTAIFWLMGNLSLASGENVYYILGISILISFVLSINSQKYNILSLGDEQAAHLGLDTKVIKTVTYVSASILVGAIVSVSGIIGFVGLIIPHLCRLIFGIDNRIIIPASFFIGSSYLILTDTLARYIISPVEIPVGAVTAIIGAPIFIYLLRKRFNLIN
ncbi:MAG: iron ABC transporter permease [Melioribacteraceae bacterium]|jgi:iron complex transport system permease protein|nr:iron ABC transporter permease [Melioribacteraceae bacterium]